MSLHFLWYSVCVRAWISVLSERPPSLMWPRWVWKGNLRSQDPQCCSHLRPLMMGQRVSRANRGRLSLARTRTRAQWPFIVVSCGSQNQSICLCWLRLRCAPVTTVDGWVSCRGEGCASSSPHHSSLSLSSQTATFSSVSSQISNHTHHASLLCRQLAQLTWLQISTGKLFASLIVI